MSSMLTIREEYEASALVGSRKTVATLVATARTSAEVTTALNRSVCRCGPERHRRRLQRTPGMRRGLVLHVKKRPAGRHGAAMGVRVVCGSWTGAAFGGLSSAELRRHAL
jgi:hypothetical protein